MWAAIRILRLLTKSLSSIAFSLDELRTLYKADLASRGVVIADPNLKDEVEVVYGYREPQDD